MDAVDRIPLQSKLNKDEAPLSRYRVARDRQRVADRLRDMAPVTSETIAVARLSL